MVTFLRRFFVVIALMFWQGGFTFYASVVVPIGQKELGHFGQGLITRHVTHYLNLAGAAALLLLAWDIVEARDRSGWRSSCRWFTWAGMLGTLGALVWLHPHLDRLLNIDAAEFIDGGARAFRSRHRLYLWLSSIQWAFSVGYVALALQTWQAEDRAGGNRATDLTVKPVSEND